MNRDPEKHRAWQRRGAANYAAKQRERGRSPQKRSEKGAPRRSPLSSRPKRNDSGWRAECIEKRGAWCRACGFSGRVELDHIVPRSQGGPSVVENGLPLCPSDHQAKTESRLRFRFEWFDADQIAWLEEVGWVSWDADGQPAGRGWRHFEPLTTKQTARRASAAGNTEGETP